MNTHYITCPSDDKGRGDLQQDAPQSQTAQNPAPDAGQHEPLIFGKSVRLLDETLTIQAIAAHVAALLGAETFPLVGKAPAMGHRWNTDKVLGRPGVQPATPQVWAAATGYGVMSPAGGDLFILESDDPLFTTAIFGAFPAFRAAPLVFSGDPARVGRCHIYLRLARAVITAAFGPNTPRRGALSRRRPAQPKPGADATTTHSEEIASLRGHGAYVVGPGSLHPASGLPYTCNDQAVPPLLDAGQSARLLARFLPADEADNLLSQFAPPPPPIGSPKSTPKQLGLTRAQRRMGELPPMSVRMAELPLFRPAPPEPVPVLADPAETITAAAPVSPTEQPVIPPIEAVCAPPKTNTDTTPRAVFTPRAGGTPQADGVLRQAVREHLLRQGYHPNGEWLNGRCPHPEKHKNQDAHPSFGFNTQSGVGKCFVCGNFDLGHVARAFGVAVPPPAHEPIPDAPPGRPCVFLGQWDDPLLAAPDTPGAPPDPDATRRTALVCELNIATALTARGASQAARLYDLLADHARAHNGQHTYTTAAIHQVGAAAGMSRAQTAKALRQMQVLGLLHKLAYGRYRRAGVAAIKKHLNMADGYASARLPRAVYRHAKRYTGALVVAVQRFLPPGLPSGAIAEAVGVSRRALYDHENALRVLRTPRREQLDPATAAVRFYKVFDGSGRFVMALDGDDYQGACEVAARNAGRLEAWGQLPSIRTFYPPPPDGKDALPSDKSAHNSIGGIRRGRKIVPRGQKKSSTNGGSAVPGRNRRSAECDHAQPLEAGQDRRQGGGTALPRGGSRGRPQASPPTADHASAHRLARANTDDSHDSQMKGLKH
jgi:hypothetical protein